MQGVSRTPFAVWLGFALACSPTRPSADGDTDDTDSSASSTDGSTSGPTSDPTSDPSAGFLDTSDWNDDGLECDLPSCLPLAQDCVDANAVCQWGMTEFVCLQRGADLAVGQPCELVTDCAAGSLCLDASIVPGCTGDSCCVPYCELGMVGGCDSLPGTSCAPFFDDPPPPGHETLGVCL